MVKLRGESSTADRKIVKETGLVYEKNDTVCHSMPYEWPQGAHLEYCNFSVTFGYIKHTATICDLPLIDEVLLQLTGLTQRDHRVDQRSLAQMQKEMQFLSMFLSVLIF